jgi:lipoyl(octanoyl) transferase
VGSHQTGLVIERFEASQPYADVLTRQLAWVNRIANEPMHPPVVILGEHGSVYTVGRKTPRPLPDQVNGVPVVAVSRGGEWTWHGPGQAVIYVIVSVDSHGGALGYLRWLERQTVALLDTVLAVRGVQLNPPHTGVWIELPSDEDRGGKKTLKKVASMGVAVRRGVAYHGVAVNVSCDLTPFGAITPCGLDSAVMTTLHQAGYWSLSVDHVLTAWQDIS